MCKKYSDTEKDFDISIVEGFSSAQLLSSTPNKR
jgi:hypothetical protein